ncbi:hypothetical protein [Calycomorphotria hydatis]|uniref:hypothetical protein n=1 Tax=Calycomorphotria hydatis TaxID=2528027 RepID=UPI0018D2591D|nr:hypothetical protein [Calycomorphotria hydatis]
MVEAIEVVPQTIFFNSNFDPINLIERWSWLSDCVVDEDALNVGNHGLCSLATAYEEHGQMPHKGRSDTMQLLDCLEFRWFRFLWQLGNYPTGE